jgi:uncharacterized Zn-binding protein involved in type VI secretion
MGIAVCRLGDLSAGHPSHPPRANVEGSGKVFADGVAIHRLGDAWAPHPVNAHPGPPDTTSIGSGKTFAEGAAVARIGDLISCGDTIATGSSKTFSI